jgi:4-hydroxy-3-methylbut-2-enyl diphosphate reductase IspH
MIKTFENYLVKKPHILYINGFRHWLIGDTLDVYGRDDKTMKILSQFGNPIIHAEIDWKSTENQMVKIVDLIKNNDICAMVGFSAGGYVSFEMSNQFRIPALSINPAMARTSSAPQLQPMPFETNNLNPNQVIVIGDKDTKETKGVDGEQVIELLDTLKFIEKGGKLLKLKDTMHLLTEAQFDKLFKYFFKKYC